MEAEYEEDFEYEDEEVREQDVVGVSIAIKEAWKIVPTLPLARFFDIALPSNISEMTDQEIIESLQEFIHQNK